MPARTTIRRTRPRWLRGAGLLVLVAAVAVVLGDRLPATPSTTVASTPTVHPSPAQRSSAPAERAAPAPPSLVDEDDPTVANLDPDLRAALRAAAADAAADGITIHVNSGWRSREHQAELLREAIAKYGSEAEAARWVATPDTSVHVSGDAIDVGPSAAAAWLAEHGAAHGLCRIYDNEPWHFELRPDAADFGCPARYPDPTHDPRLHP